jgi:ribonuclease HI/ribosomal protein L32
VTSRDDAEMYALVSAAQWADIETQKASTPIFTNIYLCSDSKSSIQVLTGSRPKNSRGLYILFKQHMENMTRRDITVTLIWTPGHSGIPGNEEADEEARSAQIADPIQIATTAFHKQKIEQLTTNNWTKIWKTQKKSAGWDYSNVQPQLKLRKLYKNNKIDRELKSRFVQVSTGHCFSGCYFHRMNIPENPKCSSCKRYNSRHHILQQCPKYQKHRHLLKKAVPDLNLRDLTTTKIGQEALINFMKLSGAFTKTGQPFTMWKDIPKPSLDLPSHQTMIRLGSGPLNPTFDPIQHPPLPPPPPEPPP